MTAQEAAHRLLVEVGKPQSSRVLAERMLKRGMVRSNSSDPVQSMAQTIEKNIRDRVYNRPELEFVHTPHGRVIAVASRSVTRSPEIDSPVTTEASTRPLHVIGPDERTFVEASARLVNRLDLVTFAGLASTREEAADLVIARGLDAMKDEIAAGMRAALSSGVSTAVVQEPQRSER